MIFIRRFSPIPSKPCRWIHATASIWNRRAIRLAFPRYFSMVARAPVAKPIIGVFSIRNVIASSCSINGAADVLSPHADLVDNTTWDLVDGY